MECQGFVTRLRLKGFKISPPRDLPKDQVIIEILKSLQEEKIIARNILRDILIRRQYIKLKENGATSQEARQTLADASYTDIDGNKYYLSIDTIHSILHNEKKRHG